MPVTAVVIEFKKARLVLFNKIIEELLEGILVNKAQKPFIEPLCPIVSI